MKVNNQIYFLTILCNSLLGCDKSSEFNLPKGDFVKFEITSVDRIYVFQDSVFQFCDPDFFSPSKSRFILSKTYNSNENEFNSLTINIEQVADTCPLDHIENNCEITFILTKIDANKKFIDYTTWNVTKIDHLEWVQKLQDGNIIINGTFGGWLFRYFPFRQYEFPMEPEKIDSILIKNGQFQLTLK